MYLCFMNDTLKVNYMNTQKEIENGKIRIENGRLVGLGGRGEEYLDIHAMNELAWLFSLTDLSDAIKEVLICITRIGLYLHYPAGTKEQVIEDVVSKLPDEEDIFELYELAKSLEMEKD